MKNDNPCDCDNIFCRLMWTFGITRGVDVMHVGMIAMCSTATLEEIVEFLIKKGEDGWTYNDALFRATTEFCFGERAK